MKTSYLDLLGTHEITGSEIQSESAVVPVTHLIDGTAINDMYVEIRDALSAWNSNLDSLAGLLSYKTTSPVEPVLQVAGGDTLERATEFGVPKSVKSSPTALLGFDYDDYDLATRFSWKFLRSATKAQVQNSVDNALSAHRKAYVGDILQRIFNNASVQTPEGNNAYGLWAADGMLPAPFMGTSFAGSHTHYLVSGALQLDSEDVESLIRLPREHGYGINGGSRLLLLVNENELDIIAGFRAGETNNNSKVAKYDFIPSSSAPAYLSSQSIVGSVAPGELSGLEVAGSYSHAWVVPHISIPSGYVACVATSGNNSPANVVGFREQPDAKYRGLQMISGNWSNYPLIEAFYYAGFGTGVRNRGAAAVMQIKTGVNADYVPPTIALG